MHFEVQIGEKMNGEYRFKTFIRKYSEVFVFYPIYNEHRVTESNNFQNFRNKGHPNSFNPKNKLF